MSWNFENAALLESFMGKILKNICLSQW